MVTERAYAKINLALTITGERDGMHLIDSIFMPIGISDTVRAEKRADGKITVEYASGMGYENDTVVRMARLIKERYGTGGVDFYIEKKIPEGRGLGGSSADAGAVARAMKRMFALSEIEAGLLLRAGSDVPYMYAGGVKRVRLLGECVEDICLPKLYVAVVVPDEAVSTKECFEVYDRIGGEGGSIEEFLARMSEGGEIRPFNALARSAERLCPRIAMAREALERAGFLCSVTGSGSAMFGVERDLKEYNIKRKKLTGLVPDGFGII